MSTETTQMLATVREATASEIDAICSLGGEVNALHHANLPELFAASGDPHLHEAHWLSSLGKSDAATYVVATDDEIIGFVTMSIATESHSLFTPMRYTRIGTVGVSTAHRGKGVGKALMARAHEWARQKNSAEVRLTVAAFNGAAIRMYEELGYTVRMHQMFKTV